jgi:hypothetical protein
MNAQSMSRFQPRPPNRVTSYRKYWISARPDLPTSRAEMDALGWDSACDIIVNAIRM